MRFLRLSLAAFTIGAASLAAVAQPAPSSQGVVLAAYEYNLDSTSYVYPLYCTPLSNTSVGACPGPGRQQTRKITTSGSSSATITSVDSDSPFLDVAAGDLLFISVSASAGSAARTAQYLVYVADRLSANSITASSAVTLPTAGVGFTWWKLTAGTSASSGWWGTSNALGQTVQLQIDQISVTGGITYSLECGASPFPGVVFPLTYDQIATANLTATGTTTLVIAEPYTACRLGLKIGTNDNLDTVTNGVNDSLDFVEDPDGTPVACVADVADGAYTGAGLATAIAAAMNTAGICAGATDPTDTYTATFNEFTGTYTITTSGTPTYATFDLPWNTGASNATSIDTLLGFAADVANAATYTGAAVTHDTSTEAEKVSIAVVKR